MLSRRWLLLIGDSSVRMIFHFLLGLLTAGWRRWPDGLLHGDQMPSSFAAAITGKPCLVRHNASRCIEDARLPDIRITCIWASFGEIGEGWDTELLGVANQTDAVPDMLLLGVGAWWAWERPSGPALYKGAVEQLLSRVDLLFHGRVRNYFGRILPRGAYKAFAATTSCGLGADVSSSRTIARFNLVARACVLSSSGWVWFNRESVTGEVCQPKLDCLGSGYPSRFHPAGDALNVLFSLLMRDMMQAHGPRDTPLALRASRALLSPSDTPRGSASRASARARSRFESEHSSLGAPGSSTLWV